MGANAGVMPGNPRQRYRPARSGGGHGISRAISNLPLLLLPQLAEHRLGMERVMGIEPIDFSRRINTLDASGHVSAIQVRDFALRGAL
jgi:hypothetical protein